MKFIISIVICFSILAAPAFAQTDQQKVNDAMQRLREKQSDPNEQLQLENSRLRRQIIEMQKQMKDQAASYEKTINDLKNDLPNPELVAAVNTMLVDILPIFTSGNEISLKMAVKKLDDTIQSIHGDTQDAKDFRALLGGLKADSESWINFQDQIEQYETMDAHHAAATLRIEQTQMAKNIQNLLIQLPGLAKTILNKNRSTATTQESQ